MSHPPSELRVAVVIPCYKVEKQLKQTIARIGPEISAIYCVIDGCPEGSLEAAEESRIIDNRVFIELHERNAGVGQAFVTGYLRACQDGANVIVKLDGDGQMAPEDIPRLIAPLIHGDTDYVKGNRFFHLSHLKSMPISRLIGNAGLSFFSKLSSGYWNLFDPTNGFIAIHAKVGQLLPWNKVHRRYFFESDLLCQLYLIRAVVVDVPMPSRYGDETSHLNILKTLIEFPCFHLQNFLKRVFYSYFLREFNIASLNLIIGAILMVFGITFGSIHWLRGSELNQFASAGTVMFAALPVILGWQALLAFLAYDVGNIPGEPLQRTLRSSEKSNDIQ